MDQRSVMIIAITGSKSVGSFVWKFQIEHAKTCFGGRGLSSCMTTRGCGWPFAASLRFTVLLHQSNDRSEIHRRFDASEQKEREGRREKEEKGRQSSCREGWDCQAMQESAQIIPTALCLYREPGLAKNMPGNQKQHRERDSTIKSRSIYTPNYPLHLWL